MITIQRTANFPTLFDMFMATEAMHKQPHLYRNMHEKYPDRNNENFTLTWDEVIDNGEDNG